MIRWTQRAIGDLLQIGEYIADDNPEAARAWVDKLRRRIEQAGKSPHAGRRVPELGREDVREVFLKTYRLVYRVESTRNITVLTIFEGHRAWDELDPDDA